MKKIVIADKFMYFDTAYIAKFYLNEPESTGVRKLVRSANTIHSSIWALAEFHAVLHRHVREGSLAREDAHFAASRFAEHETAGLWSLLPLSDGLLRRTSGMMMSAPPQLYIQTGDAVHLKTAQEAGETEVWTSDRHMLAAAGGFGLSGRTL